jgi:hypothetical protein
MALLRTEPDIPAVAADVSDYLPFPKNLLFRLKKKGLGKILPDFQRAATQSYASVLKSFRHAPTLAPVPVQGADPAVIIRGYHPQEHAFFKVMNRSEFIGFGVYGADINKVFLYFIVAVNLYLC